MPASSKKLFAITTIVVFMVLFNLGYVFHDVALGDWFHHHEREVAREHFIVPLIATAFFVYALILAYLFPIYREHHRDQSVWWIGWRFGVLMGVVFDALQGGIIEIATFKIPFIVFVVDSGYHVFVEGSVAGLLLAAVYAKWGPSSD